MNFFSVTVVLVLATQVCHRPDQSSQRPQDETVAAGKVVPYKFESSHFINFMPCKQIYYPTYSNQY